MVLRSFLILFTGWSVREHYEAKWHIEERKHYAEG